MVNTLLKSNPNTRADKLFFHPPFMRRLPSLRGSKSVPLGGGDVARKNNLSDVTLTVFLCSAFAFVPAAQPIEPMLETMTPVCC